MFLSIYKTQAHEMNWTKWSEIWGGLSEETHIQLRTRCQRELKILQDKNKCWAVSTLLHTLTQSRDSWRIIPGLTKLSLVDTLLQSSRQTNRETFKKTSLCQMNSETETMWLMTSKQMVP